MVVGAGIWAALNHPPIEPFFGLYTLGQDMRVEHYYPFDNPNIRPNQTLLWYGGVYNHMGSAEYIELRFKLLNSTITSPNETTNQPSPVEAFVNIRRLLASNETYLTPVTWSITKVSSPSNTSLRIDALTFNGMLVTDNLGVAALHGYNFRVVIELWIYDIASGGFVFWWDSGPVRNSAWNQVWFNATAH